jgi:hypothetical protein
MAGYGDDDGFTAFLTEHGYALPSGAPTAAVLRQRGSAYLDALYGTSYSGVPADGYSQDRHWPRSGAMAYGEEIPDDEVPEPIVRASYYAAWAEAQAPGSLSVTLNAARRVKRQKVGDIEREFFDGGDTIEAVIPRLSEAEGLVKPFLESVASFGIMAV